MRERIVAQDIMQIEPEDFPKVPFMLDGISSQVYTGKEDHPDRIEEQHPEGAHG